MADLKISALTGATTPLAGTEVLPIVQGGSTVKVAVSNLTAGRAVSAASLALTTTPLPASSGGTGLTAVTAGYIPFGNSATALNTDAGLFWDNTNKRLGLGTASPGTLVDVNFASTGGAMRIRNTQTDGFADVRVGNDAQANLGYLRVGGSAYGGIYQNTFSVATGGGYTIQMAPQNTLNTSFFPAGGVSIGDTTDPGAGSLRLTNNLVIGTSGKGIDFSATAGTGTSELLNDYEEGTWTAKLYDASNGGNASATTATGYYTKIGNQVTLTVGNFNNIDTTGMTGGNFIRLGDLPFTPTYNSSGSMTVGTWNFDAGYTALIPVAVGTSSRLAFWQVGDNVAEVVGIGVSSLTSGTSDIGRMTITYFV
jgi:hypothetical protein